MKFNRHRYRSSKRAATWSPLFKQRIVPSAVHPGFPSQISTVAAPSEAKAWIFGALSRGFQRLWGFSLIVAALVLVAAIAALGHVVLPKMQQETLFIDQIELPAEALSKGVTPARVELVLKTAVEQMLAAATLSQVEAMRVRSRGYFGAESQVVLGRGGGLEVSLDGNVVSASRLAFWLAATFNVGKPQTLLTVHAAQTPSGTLDVMLYARRSDGTSGSIRLPEFFPQDDYLDPESIWAQTVALQIVEMHDPKKGFHLSLLADGRWAGKLTKRSVLAYYRVAPRLSAMETFYYLHKLPPANADLAFERTRILRHAELRYPDGPWDRLHSPEAPRPTCDGLDKTLLSLVKSTSDAQLYAHSVYDLLAQCIIASGDAVTLEKVSEIGKLDTDYGTWYSPQDVAWKVASEGLHEILIPEHSRKVSPLLLSKAGSILAAGVPQTRGVGEHIQNLHQLPTDATLGFMVQRRRARVEQMLERCRNLVEGSTWGCSVTTPEEMAVNLHALGAQELIFNKDYRAAISHCLSAAALDPNEPLAALCLGRANLFANQVEEARAWLAHAAEIADSPARRLIPNISKDAHDELRRFTGWVLHLTGRPRESVELLMPKGGTSFLYSTQILEWYRAATCTADEWTGETIDQAYVPRLSWELAYRARTFLENNRPERAREFAGILLAKERLTEEAFGREDPTDQHAYEGHLLIGTSLLVQGRFEQAAAALEKAKAVRPYAAEASALLEMAKDRYMHPGHKQACSPLPTRYPKTPYSRFWTHAD